MSTSRHRARPSGPSRRPTTAILLGLAGVLVVGAAAVGVAQIASSGGSDSSSATAADDAACATTLRVAAAPEIAPIVEDLAAGAEDLCGVEVTAEAPASVAASLDDEADGTPDVWLPDSSVWLTGAGDRPTASPDAGPSVASSPLVFAVSRDTAEQLAGDRDRPQVGDLVRASTAGAELTLQVSSVEHSPERVGAVVSLYDAVQRVPEARAAMTALLRSVELTDTTPAELLTKLDLRPGAAVAVSEQALLNADREHDLDLVGIYPRTVVFDYPYLVLTEDADAAGAADQLLERLRGDDARQALQEAGFRDAEGTADAALSEGTSGTDDTAVKPAPMQPANLALAEQALALVQRDSRMLAVLDVSGSMGWAVGGRDAKGPSRISIATRAAADGLALYPDSTKLGLWTFPRTEAEPRSHRVVVPVALVDDDRRAALASALGQLREVPRGGTPLYATTVAAVRAMRTGWDPDRVNAVVILSDGKDTESRMGLSTLLAELRSMRDSSRPIPVVTIAFGPDSDAQALSAIAEASGGAFYPASSAADIRKVFLDALGQRTCRPDC